MSDRPSKIVCVGRNYRDHAKELGNDVPKGPLLFLEATIQCHRARWWATIVLPPQSSQVDYEGEIGVVIGTRLSACIRGRSVMPPFPWRCAPSNDVTARDPAENRWSMDPS